MASQIVVRLPVTDLGGSVPVCERLGFTFGPSLADENATRTAVDGTVARAAGGEG